MDWDYDKHEIELYNLGILFSDHKQEALPPRFNEMLRAISAPRDAPRPDERNVLYFRRLLRDVKTNEDLQQLVLPKFLSLHELLHDGKTSVAPGLMWSQVAVKECFSMSRPTDQILGKAIGWDRALFQRYPKASEFLNAEMCPVLSSTTTAWPLFIAEVGYGLPLKSARVHNLHNAAMLLSNIHRLKASVNKGKEFFDKVHVMSLQLSAENVQLSCYWAAQSNNNDAKLYGKILHTWSLYNLNQCIEARHYIRNAFEWLRYQAYDWICEDMALLDKTLKELHPSPDAEPKSLPASLNRSKRGASAATVAESRVSVLRNDVSKADDLDESHIRDRMGLRAIPEKVQNPRDHSWRIVSDNMEDH